MSESSREYVPTVFKEDPLRLMEFVDKRVRITTIHNETKEGNVYTIDPITESVILTNVENGEPSMDVIMRHIIKSVDIIETYSESNTVFEKIFHGTPNYAACEPSRKRKDVLMKWFREKCVPFIEEGDILIVNDILEIYPPYGSEQCVSNNTVVLAHVRNIILSLPED